VGLDGPSRSAARIASLERWNRTTLIAYSIVWAIFTLATGSRTAGSGCSAIRSCVQGALASRLRSTDRRAGDGRVGWGGRRAYVAKLE
jgi:hypothetical protein